MISGVLQRHASKLAFILTSLITILLILDTSIARIYTLIYGNIFLGSNLGITIDWNLLLFTIITAVCLIGQFLMLKIVRIVTNEVSTKGILHINKVQKLVAGIQYVIVALLISLVLEMGFTSSYSTTLLIATIAVSYSLGTLMMGYLASRFYLWFRVNRNSVVLAYTLASIGLCINITITLAYVVNLLAGQPDVMRPHVGHMSAANAEDSQLYLGYALSGIISFILTWVATSLLMRHHSNKLGKIRYWLVVFIPLGYFLSQFAPSLLNQFTEFRASDPITFGMVYNLVFGWNKTIGGILFAISFWTITRSLGQLAVREYMIISGYGLLMLFISNQAILLVNYNYPPFGLATVSFVGFSGFLVLVGIYSAAVSVGQDIELRNSIRKSALKEAGLLHNIGSAEMEQQLLQRVLSIAKRNENMMRQETGLATSLEDEEIVRYLNEVIEEVKKGKNGVSKVT